MVAFVTLLLAFLVLFGVIALGGRDRGESVASPADEVGNGDQREALFAARWLVWLGGAALALGGGFLVKYSIEHGLLGPVARVTISGAFGLTLIAAGELTRRHPVPLAVTGLRQSTIPAALTAAGLVTCYAAAFGAHALYGLIGPLPTFVLLAAVSGGAVLLSQRHGPFIGVLGLAGAYAVPALVSTREPSALALFSYLGMVNLAALAIVRLRRWWWLGRIVMAAGGLWFLLFSGQADPGPFDRAASAGYALSFGVLFALLLGTASAASDKADSVDEATALAGWGAAAGAALLLKQVVGHQYSPFDIASAAALVVVYATLAAAFVRLALLAPVAAAFALVLILAWPPFPVWPGFDALSRALPALIPPYKDALAAFAISAAALYFTLGLVNVLGGRKPACWAILSAGMPVVVLLLLHGRFEHFRQSLPWFWAAVVLAAVLTLAALLSLFRRSPHAEGEANAAIAAYLAGITAAASFAFAMRLEQAWLTAALALQLPALAWVESRLRVPALRRLVALLTLLVIVRLLFNPAILGYPVETDIPFVNWITWGYGLPAASTLTAAWILARAQRDATVGLLQAAGFIFTVAFATLQIRILMHDGNLAAPGYDLLEASLNTASWFAITYTVYRRLRPASGPAVFLCTLILFWAAVGHFVLVHGFARNPLLTGEPVGDRPLINLLLLAYGLPALFAALFLHITRGLPSTLQVAPASLLTGSFCGALVLYEGLEIRRFFHGARISDGPVSDTELYTYSAVWLVTALLVMAAGFWRRSQSVRFAGLALLAFVTFKVFLYDMSGLTGLLRVISFMGLGASLIFIGFLYQRFVLAGRKPDGGS